MELFKFLSLPAPALPHSLQLRREEFSDFKKNSHMNGEEKSIDLNNISGYQFHNYLHTKCDAFTGNINALDAESAPIFPQEPLTDPDVMNKQPDDMQNPQFYRREFDFYDSEGVAMIDLSKRYQSSAILNEYDLAARRRANDEMRTNPAYKTLEYGSIEYYKVYDDLVVQEKKALRSKHGPPTCSFDGLTKLPLISMYSETLYDPTSLRKYRRNSLACPPGRFRDTEQMKQIKRDVRRASIAYGMKGTTSKTRNLMHSHLAPISEEQSGVKPDDLNEYCLEYMAHENVEDENSKETPAKI